MVITFIIENPKDCLTKELILLLVKPTLNSSCFTNNVRELTNTKSSDYNVIVQSPSAE